MSPGLKEAMWWTVVFVVIAVVIAAGVRIVAWVTEGDSTNVWKAALVLIGASAGGGKAVTAIRQIQNGHERPENGV